MGAAPLGSDQDSGRARGTKRRREERRVALDILYQADVTGRLPTEALADWRDAGRSVPEYSARVVAGAQERMGEIDRVLGEHSEDWTVARMAVVDRSILRLACYEMGEGLPAAIAINEAVEAANALSTEASGRFINGILGRIAREDGIRFDGDEAEALE